MIRRCYCTAMLNDDGVCQYKCPPELRAPGRRRAHVRSVEAERDKRAGGIIGLRANRVSEALARISPAYNMRSLEASVRAVTGWRKR
jgi:hypothetical protein